MNADLLEIPRKADVTAGQRAVVSAGYAAAERVAARGHAAELDVGISADGVEVYHIGVSPRGQGLGSEIMRAMCEAADAHDVRIAVESGSAAAARFYERHGFEFVQSGPMMVRRAKGST